MRTNFPPRKKAARENAQVNMTPMLDIVFILLIFFIVAASFLVEFGIDMRPGSDGPACETCPAPVLVQVDEDENVFVNQVRTDASRVRAAVNRYRAEHADTAVLIEVAYEADHGTVVQLLDEMRQMGVPATVRRAEEA